MSDSESGSESDNGVCGMRGCTNDSDELASCCDAPACDDCRDEWVRENCGPLQLDNYTGNTVYNLENCPCCGGDGDRKRRRTASPRPRIGFVVFVHRTGKVFLSKDKAEDYIAKAGTEYASSPVEVELPASW